MNKTRLYTCGIAWSFETVIDNSGKLEFYNSIEALKADHPMWRECGIAAVDGNLVEWVLKPMTASEIVVEAKKKHKDEEKKQHEQDRLFRLLTNEVGIQIIRTGKMGSICIERIENGTFNIDWDGGDQEHWHKHFNKNDVINAVRFFVDKRHELKIGLDFDRQ